MSESNHNETLNVKIRSLRGMEIPQYATPGSAAFDLRADVDEPVTILPGEKTMVPTGIAIAPENPNVVGLIEPRSGLGTKKGIILSNGAGVIDSDYRGEIKVGLWNTGTEPFRIEKGDRIAQMLFLPVLRANFILAETLDETERGTDGFGSTGTK